MAGWFHSCSWPWQSFRTLKLGITSGTYHQVLLVFTFIFYEALTTEHVDPAIASWTMLSMLMTRNTAVLSKATWSSGKRIHWNVWWEISIFDRCHVHTVQKIREKNGKMVFWATQIHHHTVLAGTYWTWGTYSTHLHDLIPTASTSPVCKVGGQPCTIAKKNL